MFLSSHLYFIELIVQIPILFRLQKNRYWTWVVYDTSKSNTNFTKDVNDETLTLNPEPREDNLNWGGEEYFYHLLLFADSRRYQIFWVVVGLERGPLSLVSSIEELLE